MSYDALGDLDWLPPKKKDVFVWRLTLACGHLKLWGPFTNADREVLIGDRAACDVCDVCPPKATDVYGYGTSPVHLIVDVVEVDPQRCAPAWLEVGLGD